MRTREREREREKGKKRQFACVPQPLDPLMMPESERGETEVALCVSTPWLYHLVLNFFVGGLLFSGFVLG